MKKSQIVTLVLVTAALASASCNKHQLINTNPKPQVYMRSDTTAHYHRSNPFLWYYAFRPYGMFYNNSYGSTYNRSGYYSSAIGQHANVGTNSGKAGIVTGGLGSGGHGMSVSS